jgi:integrase
VVDLRARVAVAARALEFTILTAARSGEVLGARWVEFDLARGIWTVPADRMKGAREHHVPLSPRALSIVQEMFGTNGGSEFVFASETDDDKPLSDMAMSWCCAG